MHRTSLVVLALFAVVSMGYVVESVSDWGSFDFGTYGLASNYTGGILLSVSPEVCPRETGITLEVWGYNFTDTGEILVGFGEDDSLALLRTNCLFTNESFLACSSPKLTSLPVGVTTLQITFDNGLNWTNSIPFGVAVLYSLTPSQAPTVLTSDVSVHVGGVGFLPSASYSCVFGSVVVTGVYQSSEDITCLVPNAPDDLVGPVIVEVQLDGRAVTDFKREFVYFKPLDAYPVPQGIASEARLRVDQLPDVGENNLRCKWGSGVAITTGHLDNSTFDADGINILYCPLPAYTPELSNEYLDVRFSTDVGVSWTEPISVSTYSVITSEFLVEQGGTLNIQGERFPGNMYAFINGTIVTLSGNETYLTGQLDTSVLPGDYIARIGQVTETAAELTVRIYDPSCFATNVTFSVGFSSTTELELTTDELDSVVIKVTSLPLLGKLMSTCESGSYLIESDLPISVDGNSLCYEAPSFSGDCESTASFEFDVQLYGLNAGSAVATLTIVNLPPTIGVTEVEVSYDSDAEYALPLNILDSEGASLEYSESSFSGPGAISFGDAVLYAPGSDICGLNLATFNIHIDDGCNTVVSSVAVSVVSDLSLSGLSYSVLPKYSTNLTVSGSGFYTGSTVRCIFGDFAESIAVIKSCTSIVCETPIVPQLGEHNFKISRNGVAAPEILPIYVPELVLLNPNSGALAGCSVVIAGNYFPPGASAHVSFGEETVECAAGSSEGTLNCTAPVSEVPGYVDVVVHFDEHYPVKNSLRFLYRTPVEQRRIELSVTRSDSTNIIVSSCQALTEVGDGLIITKLPLIGTLFNGSTAITSVDFVTSQCKVTFEPPASANFDDWPVSTEFKFQLTDEEWVVAIEIVNSPPVVGECEIDLDWGSSALATISATDPDGDRVAISSVMAADGLSVSLEMVQPNQVQIDHVSSDTSMCGSAVGGLIVQFTDGFDESEEHRCTVNVLSPDAKTMQVLPSRLTAGQARVVVERGPFIVGENYTCQVGNVSSSLSIISCFIGTCDLEFSAGTQTVSLYKDDDVLDSVTVEVFSITDGPSPSSSSGAIDPLEFEVTIDTDFDDAVSLILEDELVGTFDLSSNLVSITNTDRNWATGAIPLIITNMAVDDEYQAYVKPISSLDTFAIVAPSTWETADRAFELNGDSYVVITLQEDLVSFTIEAAFEVSTKVGDCLALFSSELFHLTVNSARTSDGALVLSYYDGSQWVSTSTSTSTIEVGTAYFIALRVDADEPSTTIYLDGTALLTLPVALEIGTEIIIGGVLADSVPRYLFVGTFQEIRVFDIARDALLIQTQRESVLSGTEEGLVWYAPEDIEDPLVGASPAVCVSTCEKVTSIVAMTGKLIVIEDTETVFRAFPLETNDPVQLNSLPRGGLADYSTKTNISAAPHAIADPLNRLVYTPPENEYGDSIDSFVVGDIVFSVDIIAVNDVPEPEAGTVVVQLPSSATIVLNATDVEDDPLTFRIDSVPDLGTLFALDTDGETVLAEVDSTPYTLTSKYVLYQPAVSGAYEADSNFDQRFTFSVSDESATSAAVPVTISVVRNLSTDDESSSARWVGLSAFLVVICILVTVTIMMRRRNRRREEAEEATSSPTAGEPNGQAAGNKEARAPVSVRSP